VGRMSHIYRTIDRNSDTEVSHKISLYLITVDTVMKMPCEILFNIKIF